MPVIAVANQKGGVGKTTTVVNLAASLYDLGYRVCVVDNDPQANLALSLGIQETDRLFPTLGDLLIASVRQSSDLSPRDAIVETSSGIHLLPSNVQLSAADLALVAAIGREMIMRDILGALRPDYDYILIDCLPSLGLLAINGLTAADGVLIPVQADYLAMQGLGQIMETVAAVRAKLNPDLQILGVLLTMVDARTSHAREVCALLRRALADQVRVFESEVRLQVGLKDSIKSGMSVLAYRPDSQGAQAYRDLAREVETVLQTVAPRPPSAAALAASRSSAVEAPIAPALEQLAQELEEPSFATTVVEEEEQPLLSSSVLDEVAQRLFGPAPEPRIAEEEREAVPAPAPRPTAQIGRVMADDGGLVDAAADGAGSTSEEEEAEPELEEIGSPGFEPAAAVIAPRSFLEFLVERPGWVGSQRI